MIPRNATASRALTRALTSRCSTSVVTSLRPAQQLRHASTDTDADADPGMNGGYINPPRVNRQHRDPHADWWDKQERRNYGEPVHEDNDILGVMSLEEYSHVTPRKALFQVGCFIAAVFGLTMVVGRFYPDKPSAPRTYPGGLDTELGGERAALALRAGDVD